MTIDAIPGNKKLEDMTREELLVVLLWTVNRPI